MSSSCSVSSLDQFLFKMNSDGAESTPVASEAQTDGSCEAVLKRCSKCHLEFSLDEFYNYKNAKDGLTFWCKACFRAHKKRPREDTDPCDEPCDAFS